MSEIITLNHLNHFNQWSVHSPVRPLDSFNDLKESKFTAQFSPISQASTDVPEIFHQLSRDDLFCDEEAMQEPGEGSMCAKHARRLMLDEMLAEVNMLLSQSKLANQDTLPMLSCMLNDVKDMYFEMYGRTEVTEQEVTERMEQEGDKWFENAFDEAFDEAQNALQEAKSRYMSNAQEEGRAGSMEKNLDASSDSDMDQDLCADLAACARAEMLEDLMEEVKCLHLQSDLGKLEREKRLQVMLAEVASIYFEMYGRTQKTWKEVADQVLWVKAYWPYAVHVEDEDAAEEVYEND